MRKKIALALLLLFLFPPVSGLFAGQEKNRPEFNWKAATLAPSRVGWVKRVKEIFRPNILRCSEGRVLVKIYSNGVMGDDEEMIRKMRQGILQVAGLAGHGTVMACPEFAVVELPFLFKGYDEVDYIREKMFPTFEELTKKNGFILFLWVDQGFDQVFSLRLPMTRAEHFKRSLFLTWYGPVEERLFHHIGAKSKPLEITEAVYSVRGKEGDAIIAPAIWVLGGQAHPAVKYVNPIKIRYSPASIMVDKKAFLSLPQKYRDCLWPIRDQLAKEFTLAFRQDSEKALMAMLQYGMDRSRMDPLEVQELKVLSRPVWNELAGVLYPRELLDEVLDHLKQYREAGPSPGTAP